MKSLVKLICLAMLIQALSFNLLAQPRLWGTLPLGGSTEAGILYQLDLNGYEFQELYDFKQYLGKNPRHHIILAANNKFYGVAQGGYGQFGSFIYEYDPAGATYTVVHDLYDPVVGHSYSTASAYLMQASDGLIYGFNHSGGTTTEGQLFSLDPDNWDFNYLADFEAATTGSNPIGGLVEAGNGKLYGQTHEGGGCNCGMLFSYDPATGVLASAYDLGGTGGAFPVNGLTLASNGLLYGMTREGGTQGQGILFKYETGTGIFTLLHDFNPANDGGRPYGRLFQASDGYLYGMCSEGGGSGMGIIFRYDIDLDLFNVVYSFDGPTGDFPLGGFVEQNGYLYAMTSNGGVADRGVLFRFDLDTYTLEKLTDFYSNEYGEYPDGSLSIGPDGNLYGQTYSGGKYGRGIMFMYNTTNMLFTKCFDFGDAADGAICFSNLMKASDEMIYGTTQYGGFYDAGSIYRINPANRQFESIFDFDIYSSGGGPYDGLMEASDGFLYGVTPFGGSVNMGTLYRLDMNTGVYTVIHDLITVSEGQEPRGVPIEVSDGILYGVTRVGGTNGEGTLYKFNLSTNVCTKQADFNDLTTGKYPSASIVKATNGKLYGLAMSGGQHTYGTLYEYDMTSATLQAMAFDGLNKGRIPVGTLLEYEDNMLYGMCHMGGLYDAGTLFVVDLDALVCTKLFDFNPAATGYEPMGSLIKASNGKLYGATNRGGAFDSGVIFEFDPETATYTTIHDFTSFREYPWFGTLLEVETDYGIDEDAGDPLKLTIYPNPMRDRLTIEHEQAVTLISIFNQSGQLVLERTEFTGDENIILDLEFLDPGIYVVRIQGQNGNSETAKFVKTN